MGKFMFPSNDQKINPKKLLTLIRSLILSHQYADKFQNIIKSIAEKRKEKKSNYHICIIKALDLKSNFPSH